MKIHIEDNPNCQGSEEYAYKEMGAPRRIRGILIEERGVERFCQVIGVGQGPTWSCASAIKVTDSGEGFAYLIFGGEWGIRLEATDVEAQWSLSNPKQWGEAFKIYGSEKDIVFADEK